MNKTVITILIRHNGQSCRAEMEAEPEIFDNGPRSFIERIVAPMVFAAYGELVEKK